MLDVNPDTLRGVAESVRDAATALIDTTQSATPGCGGDEVSQTIMDNLNARRKWLADHVRTGHEQAWGAASATDDTATSFEHGDAAMADILGGAAGGVSNGGSSRRGGPGRSSATPMPSVNPIPDISGRDGESLARQLESGAGAAPAVSAAAQCSALAGKAAQAAAHFAGAQALLTASGTSEAHGPMLARLARAQVWAQGVAGHAQDLAESYTAAAQSHIAACGAVRSSQEWEMTKTSFNEAVAENQATGGMMQERVEALKTLLDSMQQEAVAAMGGYQSAGELFSIPTVGLLDPHVSPDGPAAAPDPSPAAAADPEILSAPPPAGMPGTGTTNLGGLISTATAGSARSAVQALSGSLSPGIPAVGGSGSSGSSGAVFRPAGLPGGASPTGSPGGAAASGLGGGMAPAGSPAGSPNPNSPNASNGPNPGAGEPGGVDPGQDPEAIDGSDPDDDDQTGNATSHSGGDDRDQSGPNSMQNLLGPLMGAAGPAMGALGKGGGGGGNPLESLGQVAQSLEQQLGKQFGGHKGHPLTPLTHAAPHHPGSGHLGGGAAKGGGGLGHVGASVHPAAAKSTPASPPPGGASGSGQGASTAAGSGMGGAGMMPMGAGSKGAKPSVKPNIYPEPIQTQPAGTGRAGIVGRDPAQADRSVLDPAQDKSRRERVARRKKSSTDDALDL